MEINRRRVAYRRKRDAQIHRQPSEVKTLCRIRVTLGIRQSIQHTDNRQIICRNTNTIDIKFIT